MTDECEQAQKYMRARNAGLDLSTPPFCPLSFLMVAIPMPRDRTKHFIRSKASDMSQTVLITRILAYKTRYCGDLWLSVVTLSVAKIASI